MIVGSAPPVPGRRPRLDQPSGAELLTARELEVARRIGRGRNTREIASDLDLAEATVKTHVRHVLEKLALSNRVQVAVWAWTVGEVGREGDLVPDGDAPPE